MIRIIKHGTYRTCSCYACGCIFTFEKEDVNVEELGGANFSTRVQCPDCYERNTVNLTGDWYVKTVL